MRTISFKRIDSRSELLELLKQQKQFVLLGDKDEATNEYFKSTSLSCAVGVMSQGQGVVPCALLDEINNEVWIGYNSKVASIDISRCRIRFEIHLDWIFISILSLLSDGSIIAVNELGASRISRSGEMIWNYSTEVVTDFADEGDYVCLCTDDEISRINKESGELN